MTEEAALPNPSNSIFYFFVITIIYGFFLIYNLFSANTLIEIESTRDSTVVNLIYIGLLISGIYFINLKTAQTLCKSSEIPYYDIFFATFLPWIMIFGTLYFALELFPGWIGPFSNTIGYFVINMLGAEDTVKNMLKTTDDFTIDKDKDKDKDLKKAIQKIDSNTASFINELNVENQLYKEFCKKLCDEGFIKNYDSFCKIEDNEHVQNLYKFVNIKHAIGKLIWYILAGTLICSISYNFIINEKCEKTVEEQQAIIDQIMANENTPETPG